MGRRTERKSLPGAVFFFLLLLFFCSSRIVLDSKARIEGGVCIPRGTMRTKGDEQEEIQRFCNNLFRRFFPLIYCIFRSVSFFFFFLYEIPRRVHERVRTNVIRRHEIKSVSNRRTKRKRGRERERERREGEEERSKPINFRKRERNSANGDKANRATCVHVQEIRNTQRHLCFFRYPSSTQRNSSTAKKGATSVYRGVMSADNECYPFYPSAA